WIGPDPGDEAPRRRLPVAGIVRVALGEPGLLADRLEPKDECEHRHRRKNERRAMERQTEAGDQESAVDRVTSARVDARALKGRTVTWARKGGKRPSECDPARDDHPPSGCFEHEAGNPEPGLAVMRPVGPDNGASGHRDNDRSSSRDSQKRRGFWRAC